MKKRTLAIALIAATTACASTKTGVLSVRPVNEQPVGLAKDALDRGDLLFARGDHALALDAFRKAVRYDPNDAHALNGVAISYAAMGRHDLAREYFELALARAPQDARIYRNFARSLEAQGLRGEAEILMAQARSLAPGSMATQKMAGRPTLAQLAANGMSSSATNAPRPARLELERLSLGEVRLRTGAPVEDGRAGTLTTRIVTVADAGASMLNMPILTIAAEPASAPKALATLSGARPSTVIAKQPVALVKAASARPDTSACGEGARAQPARFRLPATGYAIDLPKARKDGCASWAGDGTPDGLFERLWKGWLQPASAKDGRG